MARAKAKSKIPAPAVAQRAADIFGTPSSIFTNRAKVTALGLQRGVSEMIRRVYATVPGVAPMSPAHPTIKVTFIGDTACARYSWATAKGGRLSVAGCINLPATGEDQALIPRSIADQYTGYSLHELGHLLFTPLNAFSHAISTLARKHGVSGDFAKSIVNGLEDVVIERELIRSGYAPGAGAMLSGLLAKCIADVPASAYGTIRAFPVTLCFGLRGYGPGADVLVNALPPQLRAIYDFAAGAVAALPARAIGNRDALDGLLPLCDEVLRRLCELRQKPPPGEPGDDGEPSDGEPGDDGEPGEPSDDDDDDGEPSDDDDGEPSDDDDGDDGEPSDDDGEPSDDDDGEPSDGEPSDGEPSDDGDPFGNPDDKRRDPSPIDETPAQPDDVTEPEPEKEPGADLDTNDLNGTPIDTEVKPNPAGDPADGASGLDNDNVRIFNGYEASPDDVERIRAESAAVLNKAPKVAHALRVLLDAGARDSREGGKRSGTLRASALSRVATGADTVFERRTYQDGTDSAVSVLIDRSSSMIAGNRMHAARTLGAALAKILSQCSGVRSEILGFYSGGGGGGYNTPTGQAMREILDDEGSAEDQQLYSSLRGDCAISVMKAFDDAPAVAMKRLAACGATGGTPDAAALNVALSRLLKQQAGLRVFIHICDGEGSPDVVLTRILQRYERAGVLCIGVGIEMEVSQAFTYRVKVEDINKLSEAGLDVLLRAVAKARPDTGGGDD